ncbi:MAG: prephenate dehydrogenase [Deltaproteobacteria bacterium GWC2_56_8]|nr:MAG: prephenate dehydrogenase [Deltaproteobacteria bacterium GWB2_55_19]OGP33035.1 MAG: prephenate dehydrogenase [Deltaproteobacteria bacterium GWC2_56_8]HAO93532.1 prephenate dehydrogenase/arogenate dehydrogenase family protein [Deltaproteobacteria bacterium]
MAFYFKKITVIGVGLIGGSLSIILRRKGLAGSITGVGRGLANLEAAKRLGVVDSFTQDVGEGVKDADFVLIATPVLKIGETVRKAAPFLKKGAIVTDVGSVKKAVIDECEPLIPKGVHFVPGHPIAGTEHSGVEAAFPDLFKGRRCILTPTDNTDDKALSTVKEVWEAAGSEVVVMDPSRHDAILAAVSHLPHMIAYSLVNTVGDIEKSGVDALSYSAGGFRDFTRIASSSPEMWADICAMNSDAILKTISDFEKRLANLKTLIDANDVEGLKHDFARAKSIRDSLVNKAGKLAEDK